MKLKPLADRVIIRPTAAEETTINGIIIPDSAKEKPLKGTGKLFSPKATKCTTASTQAPSWKWTAKRCS